MARVFPKHIVGDTKSAAERKLFTRFEQDLGEEFVVFHSVAWLAQASDGRAFDGEADFLIAHPDLGVLVLEVKGGHIGYDGKMGKWFSIDRHGKKHLLSRDPQNQAKDSRYNLHRKLRATPTTRSFRYPVYHAVCFPDTVAEVDIRLDLPMEIILDKKRLSDLEKSIREIFQYWEKDTSQSGPGDRGIAALIDLLAPTVELRSYMAVEFEEELEQIKQLTQQQFMTLDLLSRERQAIVLGCAGSGKTLLAMEKARRLAKEGFSVLFTCFNAQLADWLNSSPYNTDGIEIIHFHKLCTEFTRRAKVTIPSLHSEIVEGDEDYYFDSILPQALLEAASKDVSKYDALIVDEGQDFKDSWWIALEALLANSDSHIFYIFCDDNQNIYAGSEKEYPFTSPAITLTRNCRNTQEIHAVVSRYYSGASSTKSQGPVGRKPEIIPVDSNVDLIKVLQHRLHELVSSEQIRPQDIVILTPRKEKLSQFKTGARLGNLILTWHPTARNGEIECSTIHAFKGLERPIVILTELDHLAGPDQGKLAYIGVSRARNHLIVFGELPPIVK